MFRATDMPVCVAFVAARTLMLCRMSTMIGMNSVYWITLSSFSSASARICRICLMSGQGGAGKRRDA